MIRAILTDIEGTTTSISFVKDVLFPYSRSRLPPFVRERAADPSVIALLSDARKAMEQPLATDEAVVAQLQGWIDEDRKITVLKALQGLMWDEGYRRGDFRGHVYPDAAEYLARWHRAGLKLYVFSSGSVHAQKLLFGHSDFGDLTPLFSGYFDTSTGAKSDPESYRLIAKEIRLGPDEILFLSDVAAELDAAASAGMATCQLLRPGKPGTLNHKQAETFSQVVLPS
ncbi:MAG: acireductone synthase [Methylococcaceae bacterium]|nr:acireductone synthase [Methylococcaceae bacterium]